MKKIYIISIAIVVLTLTIYNGWSQTRGVTQVDIKIDGAPTTLYQESHALLIGVSNYNNGLHPLPGVADDIAAVKEAVEANGFSVDVVMDPDNVGLEDAFKKFIGRYGQSPDNRLLFYFAGHGHTVRMPYGEDIGYICPVNAPDPTKDSSDFEQKAMPMAHIETFAKQIKSKHALFIFDACFSGSVFAMSRAIPDVISYKTREPVRQFITSGSAEETVPDKSIFREQFIVGIRGEADVNNDHYVTGTELGEFLFNTVVNYSYNSQHPQYGKIRNSHLDKGDFVFVMASAAAPEGQGSPPANPVVTNPTPVFTPVTRVGRVEVTSQMAGYLYLDGGYIKYINANTPVPLSDLSAGPHTIKFSGDETTEKTVDVLPGKSISLTFERKKKKIVSIDNFDMVLVDGGTFLMGSDRGGRIESPVHGVTLDTFYIGQYEITQKQWQDVMGDNPSRFNDCFNCPVENVSFNDVQRFLEKLNKKTGKKFRLPTEAEWEYAACGGTSGRANEYSGSNNANDVAWYVSTSGEKTHAVGQKKANELGIYDMSGNVWEWCSDYFEKDYYSVSPSKNPKGPPKTNSCVLRGGAYDCGLFLIRTRNRGRNFPFEKGSLYGFRLCMSK